jgi:hypothetical protein
MPGPYPFALETEVVAVLNKARSLHRGVGWAAGHCA